MTDAAIVALVVGVLGMIGWIIKNVFNAISENTTRVARVEVKLQDVEKDYDRIDLIVTKLSDTVQSLDKTVHQLAGLFETMSKRRRASDD